MEYKTEINYNLAGLEKLGLKYSGTTFDRMPSYAAMQRLAYSINVLHSALQCYRTKGDQWVVMIPPDAPEYKALP